MLKSKTLLRRNLISACFSTVVLVSLCFTGSTAPAPVANDADDGRTGVHTIVMSNKEPSYAPAEITIGVGDTVRWLNSEKSDTHSIHERAGALISPDVAAGKQWCFQFTHEGEYTYTCRFHPWMKGKIIVKARDLNIQQIDGPLPAELKPKTEEVTLLKRAILSSAPLKVIATADRKLWFIEDSRNVAGSYDTSSGDVKEYQFAPGASLTDIAASSSGLVWLTDAGRNKVIKIENGWLTEYTIPTSFSSPQSVDVDRDGRVWFAEQRANKIGLLQDGNFQEYSVPQESEPSDLRVDSKGNLWFAQRKSPKLGFIPAETVRGLSASVAQQDARPCSTSP
jgi:plastocyanin